MSRIFLAIVGAAYVLLAAWCAVAPGQTSKSVGFELQPGSGQSEYLVIYGGLQLALGLVFLWPLVRPQEVAFPLLACLIVHACLVLFRMASFALYGNISSTTYFLSGVEWAILLGAAFCFWRR
jgi:hypothetical protein